MRPWSLLEIDQALRTSWAADTCSPDDAERAPWTTENPAWGHCDITALVVHDLLGGELMVGDVYSAGGLPQGYHWWNRLGSGVELDMTREQFREGQEVVGARVVERPRHRRHRRGEEYGVLRTRVSALLGVLPSFVEEGETSGQNGG
ncbi:YunG family protein [Actinocorallia libanotica]|uniref:Uncharacterized protein n=1 Tax=Actinocorallia libanotica TaxID=46162 RepID=A0ABN1QEN2_9ACTN